MTREVQINGRPSTLLLEGARLRYGGDFESGFSIVATAPGTFSVLLDGRSYRVTLGPRGETHVNGVRLTAEVFDPRDMRSRKTAAGAAGRQHVLSSMPGKVVRVLVAAGDTVEEGQGLVVVEAMKMQNEMKSPKKGRVSEIRATPNATVGAGDVLVVVE